LICTGLEVAVSEHPAAELTNEMMREYVHFRVRISIESERDKDKEEWGSIRQSTIILTLYRGIPRALSLEISISAWICQISRRIIGASK